jgi:F-type H+-transporting ATPase subunit b
VLIDWFTVAAQIVNFLVLMALLKYFLYDRVIQAMDKRRQDIQDRLDQAESKEKQASRQAEALASEKKEFEAKKEKMLSQARQEVQDERGKWQDEARREVDRLREHWVQSVENEKERAADKIRRLAAQHVHDACRQVLNDLAGEVLEEKLLDRFLEKIEGLNKQDRHLLVRETADGRNRALVRTHFEIKADMRRKITRNLKREISEELILDYETDSELLAGIELIIAGKRVSWSLAGYLQDLHDRTLEALSQDRGLDQSGRNDGGQKALHG